MLGAITGDIDASAAGMTPPALAAAFTASSWDDAVRTAAMLGGDADTLACIAGSVAEAILGLPDEVSRRAEDHLTVDLKCVLYRFLERGSLSNVG